MDVKQDDGVCSMMMENVEPNLNKHRESLKRIEQQTDLLLADSERVSSQLRQMRAVLASIAEPTHAAQAAAMLVDQPSAQVD